MTIAKTPRFKFLRIRKEKFRLFDFFEFEELERCRRGTRTLRDLRIDDSLYDFRI